MPPPHIPQTNPRAAYLARKPEIDAALSRVLDGGTYIQGAEVEGFEAAFARYLGVPHAIGVGSGTEALHVALRAAGIGPGDEVITVAHTAVATVAAIELAGATPVLVDVHPLTLTLDPRHLDIALTPRTKAIVPVHLYGRAADLGPILRFAGEHGLRVIEDCAQAHGARYRGKRVGAWGDLAAFSFYPTKNLGCIGDGGLVATRDEGLADRVRLLREYGWRRRHLSETPGLNSRLDPLQAAILSAKLPHLDEDNARRGALAARYDALLRHAPLQLPAPAEEGSHVHHLYVIRAGDRAGLQAHLRERGIETLVHYPVPIHLQPAYLGRILTAGPLMETEAAAREILSLPLFPELPHEDVERVCEAILEGTSTPAREVAALA